MSEPAGPVRRGDYRPPAWLVDHVDLHLALAPDATQVQCRLRLRRNPACTEGSAQTLRLDGNGLELLAIALDDIPLPDHAYRVDHSALTVFHPPERCTLSTAVRIHPAANTGLMGLYYADGLMCSQCEPEAFRRITYYPDRPDVLATFRTTLAADPRQFPVLLANGNPVARRQLGDGRQELVWDDPIPKPSYLFAVVAGNLHREQARFATRSGRHVDVNLYVETDNRHQCGHALEAVRRAMTWDEIRYGREYDLDEYNLVAVSQYTMGAMENKGLNIFNDRYLLASPQTATDRDYRDIEALVAHEYFHNWSGNRVTCRDWFQLCLKEGFTVFREQQFAAEQGWGAIRRLEDVRLMRERQFSEDAGPLAHAVRPDRYTEIDNFYTDTVYSKGAELVRMLHALLGPETFRRATDLYFSRHDGEAVTVEDFLACMSEVSGRDLAQFARWFDRPGTPLVTATGNYDGDNQLFHLQLTQESTRLADGGTAEPLHLPVALALLDHRGRHLPLELKGDHRPAGHSRLLELREHHQHYVFRNVPSQPIPSLLRGFSTPAALCVELSAKELHTLILQDDDAYVRWDALQRLWLLAVREEGGADDTIPGEFLARAIASLLDRVGSSPGMTAELLAPPAAASLAAWIPEPDIEDLHLRLQGAIGSLANTLMPAFETAYSGCRDGANFQCSPAQVGRRALKNRCLAYLAACGDGSGYCLSQYRSAGNLTDALAALQLLVDLPDPTGEQVLTDFRRRWAMNNLVLDKWFAAQARSTRADALERVLALMRDASFSHHRPNRVRSLVETFCAGNPVRFHRADGAGYRFLADQVLAIDPINPQLAAGLARHLLDWRPCNTPRRHLLRQEIRRIGSCSSLSTGVAELAERALNTDTVVNDGAY